MEMIAKQSMQQERDALHAQLHREKSANKQKEVQEALILHHSIYGRVFL
jgi:hypothetical protein